MHAWIRSRTDEISGKSCLQEFVFLFVHDSDLLNEVRLRGVTHPRMHTCYVYTLLADLHTPKEQLKQRLILRTLRHTYLMRSHRITPSCSQRPSMIYCTTVYEKSQEKKQRVARSKQCR